MSPKKQQQIPEKLKDFRNFLYYVWHSLEQIKRDPTPIQYDIAEYMQHGPKRAVIQGFRGVGKSWICSAFVVHQLLLDPAKNILVISASKTRADDFSTFTLRLLHDLPLLEHLKPTAEQRFSKVSFDVGLAPASHAPSVKSLGITSQLTGSRADIIIADDIEVPTNSATQAMRDKLSEQIKEFDAILKPNDAAKILFLGTPQCEDSVYTKIRERGYMSKVWPAESITENKNYTTYGNCVSSLCITEQEGEPTEPTRFTEFDLNERKISYGSVGYALQFMLNPSLSDVDKFPLKLSNLIIYNVDTDVAPEKVVWARTPDLEWADLPCVGLRGDRFYRPMDTVGDLVPYTGSVLAIDPSGRGKDETGYAVVKMLNGTLFVPEAGGISGGYEEQTLIALKNIASRNKVNTIVVESNFGDGMFTQLMKPILRREYPCTIEEVRHSQQKEKRIIDTLEPLLGGHRLVISPSVIENDYKTAQKYPPERQLHYMMFHEMTRITSARGSIRQDDRLDALAIGCNYWVEQMAQDADRRISERKNDLAKEELSKFVDSFYKSRNSRKNSLSWIA
jgi:hypothetical protein